MRKIIVFFIIAAAFAAVLPKTSKASDTKINEFLPNPPSGGKEFIEIYSVNTSDFKNYYFKDSADHKKIIDTTQNCGNYYVWELESGDGYLNNTGDESVFLYDSSDNLVDSYENWSSPGEGVTLSRVPDGSGSFVEAENTKCASNLAKIQPTPTPKNSPSPTPANSSSPATSPKTSPSPKVTPKPSASPQANKQASDSAAVLGEKDTTSAPPIDNFSASPAPSASYQSPVSQKVAAMLIGSGAILIGLSFASFVWYKRSQDKLKINKNQDRFEENKIEE